MSAWLLLPIAAACVVALLFASVVQGVRATQRQDRQFAGVQTDASRGHVLYLRAFREDNTVVRPGVARREEYLEQVFREAGPLLAVGRPGEVCAPLGAHRVYFSDDQWQPQVLKMIRQARVILVAADVTDGLRWELRQLVAHARPESVVVALPYGRAIFGPIEGPWHRARRVEVYEGFRSLAADIFPHPLPPATPHLAYLGFGPDWKPLLLPAPAGWRTWVLGQTPYSRVGITETVRAHLARQGIELSWWRTVVRGLLFFPFMGILQSLLMIATVITAIVTVQMMFN